MIEPGSLASLLRGFLAMQLEFEEMKCSLGLVYFLVSLRTEKRLSPSN